MSSVSTEQQQICARNYPQIQKARRNLKHLIIWKRWKFLLAPITTNSNGETWCKIVSAYSNNCPMTRSYPSYALTLVWALSKKDKTSSHLIQKKEIGCNIYTENTQCLDAKRRFERKDGFSRIRGSGPVLDKKVCRHEYRYSIEVLNESLFRDRTASWVRIVSGIDKYVTEAVQTKEEEHRDSARPQLKPAVTLSSVLIPVHGGKWIDIETQRSHDQQCYQTSKVMTWLPRHDQTVLGKLRKQFYLTTSWKNAGRKSSMVLRNGHSTIGSSSKLRYIGAILKLAQEKGLQFLPNTVTCYRSLRDTACRFYWESGMYENEGGALHNI